MSEAPANWYPDPLQRYEHRYWDGQRWTEHVATGGQVSSDPLEAAGTPAETTAARTEGADAGTGTATAAGAAWPAGSATEWGAADGGTAAPGAAGASWPGGGTASWETQAAAKPTNGKAVAALVTSLVGLPLTVVAVGVLLAIVGIVLGVMARREIRDSGGREGGDGLALAGIIVGALTLLLTAAMLMVFALFVVGPVSLGVF